MIYLKTYNQKMKIGDLIDDVSMKIYRLNDIKESLKEKNKLDRLNKIDNEINELEDYKNYLEDKMTKSFTVIKIKNLNN